MPSSSNSGLVPNVWDLPGGHVDTGERRMDALVRELGEELGIELDVSRCVSVLPNSAASCSLIPV